MCTDVDEYNCTISAKKIRTAARVIYPAALQRILLDAPLLAAGLLTFDNVERVISSHSVYGDIGEFQVSYSGNGLKKYIFYSAWYDENGEDKEVLSIEAEKMEIFQVGIGAEINSAVFNVGYEYVGNQKCPYY